MAPLKSVQSAANNQRPERCPRESMRSSNAKVSVPQLLEKNLPWQDLNSGKYGPGLALEGNDDRSFHTLFLAESPQTAEVALVNAAGAFHLDGHIDIAKNEVH